MPPFFPSLRSSGGQDNSHSMAVFGSARIEAPCLTRWIPSPGILVRKEKLVTDHAGIDPHAGHGSDSLTRSAVSATLHCLTGCAIGEVLGMILATWWGWGNVASIVLAIVLAFFFGYSLTVGPVLRAGVPFRRALPVAFASDTASISVMEIVDNAFILIVPGAIEAELRDALFWWSLGVSLIFAFVFALPLNRWLIARGRGHAVVHAYHSH
jgi:Domain of unknown function (DUF4396)